MGGRAVNAGADGAGLATLCRECLGRDAPRPDAPARCPACGSPRLVRHRELDRLTIAHIDCDAFYASVEKRDDPALADKPVIVGGGRRGVVSAACYVARLYGVRSAMPMFKALQACPDAVVIKPDMAKYAAVGREVRALMREATPLVEPISIDEAFLDLSGMAALTGASPARALARLVLDIEREIGVTASVGLSYNKFLAKIASDLDKPRGFAAIGTAEARGFLKDKPVSLIWGVGKALEKRLHGDGIFTIGQLQTLALPVLTQRHGAMGRRLYHFARGEDTRRVEPEQETKSISAETTFETDRAALETLAQALWPLCETVSRRLKAQGFAARAVTLKLRRADFSILTRSRRLASPTQLADTLFATGRALLAREADGTRFRLLGIGASDLADSGQADTPDLFDARARSSLKIDRAVDALRAKHGPDAVRKGRSLFKDEDNPT